MEELLYQMIFKRKSFHLFQTPGQISHGELSRIEEAFPACTPLIPGIRTQMRIVPAKQTACKRGQEYCLLFYSETKAGYLPNIGYIGEQMDLLLTSMDIGTLWYGIGRGEALPGSGMEFVIMIAIGKMEPNRFRKDMFKAKRKPTADIWFGEDLGIAGILRFAPSACNTQPWMVEHNGNTLKVFRIRQPGKRGIMPADKVTYYNRIDIGIFLLFLEVCLDHKQLAFDRTVYADRKENEKNLAAVYSIKERSSQNRAGDQLAG